MHPVAIESAPHCTPLQLASPHAKVCNIALVIRHSTLSSLNESCAGRSFDQLNVSHYTHVAVMLQMNETLRFRPRYGAGQTLVWAGHGRDVLQRSLVPATVT